MKITKLPRSFLVFVLFFGYSLGISAAIQCYIVPKMFPHFDRGDGIIILDSNGFNQIAKEKAAEIREKGWTAWELRPQAQSPAGIASAFYALLTPKPYTLLPYNALVHALSGCLVLWALLHIFSWWPAFFGSLLFVVNPAALQWVAQIHRDGIFILGNLLVLFGMLQFLNGLKSANTWPLVLGFSGGVAGTVLVWVARLYWVQILLIFVLLVSLLLALSRRGIQRGPDGRKLQGLYYVFFVVCLLLFQGWLVKYHSVEFINLPSVSAALSEPQGRSTVKFTGSSPAENARPLVSTELAHTPVRPTEKSVGSFPAKDGRPLVPAELGQTPVQPTEKPAESSPVQAEIDRPAIKPWERSYWLPDFVERKLYHLSVARLGAIMTGGNTVVDTDVRLNSARAFVEYFPRALQLGLLSPFPNLWRGEASTPVMTMARKIMGATTVVFYFFLLGLLVGVISHRKNLITWIILMFCFLGILMFSYTYPNVGTLLRFRYGFYMLLIAFGAANIAEMFLRWQKKRLAEKSCFLSSVLNRS